MNSAFTALLLEKIRFFEWSFLETSRETYLTDTGELRHKGEFGSSRERALRDFLRTVCPAALHIGSGFVISASGGVSTQTDIVIYDGLNAPHVESMEHQRFFPVESVCGIGEVKSVLNRAQLIEALKRLSRTKAMREELVKPEIVRRVWPYEEHPHNPMQLPHDQMFSFLVCERIDCDLDALVNGFSELYGAECPLWRRHNMVLSIKDGLLLYAGQKDSPFPLPFHPNPSAPIPLKNRLVVPSDGKWEHCLLFATYVYLQANNASIFKPDMGQYLPSIKGSTVVDES